MDLGQVSHYLADYFTFPHNEIYTGSLKDHCSYEEKLKRDLREYLARNKRERVKAKESFGNAEALCNFIQAMHDDYIQRKHDVEDDIQHIIEVNEKALYGMMELLARRRGECYA